MQQHAPERPTIAGAELGQSLAAAVTSSVVDRVLDAYRAGRLVEERLAEGARLLSGDARRRGLGEAQMIREIERALSRRAAPTLAPDAGAELHERLVRLCVNAYHAQRARQPDDL